MPAKVFVSNWIHPWKPGMRLKSSARMARANRWKSLVACLQETELPSGFRGRLEISPSANVHRKLYELRHGGGLSSKKPNGKTCGASSIAKLSRCWRL